MALALVDRYYEYFLDNVAIAESLLVYLLVELKYCEDGPDG